MYQFLCGFCVGVYVGTKYNMKPFIKKIEQQLKSIEKKD